MLLKGNVFIEWKISYIGPLKVPCWSWTLEPLGEPQGTSTGVCWLGACRISCSVLEKIWHLNWWSTKKSHSLFLAFGFLRGVTHFYGITFAMTYDFSRISKNNVELQQSISKGISSTTLLDFFLCAELPWPLHWPRTSS